MKSQKPLYFIKQKFLQGGLSRLSIAQTINNFKKDFDYHELMDALPAIMQIDPRFKKFIWGNLFPKDYLELGVGNNYYFRSQGVFYELNWILVQVAKHKKELKAILESRDKIYNYLTIGDYNRTDYELRELENSYGVSVWSTEMHLLCNSLSNHESKSFELLEKINSASDIVKDKGKTGYVPLLAHFLFKRSSTQSALSYERELKALTKRNRNDFQVDRFKYYQFRLNYYGAREHSQLDSLLIYETANALIDKYMSVLHILKWLFENSEVERTMAIECANKLYNYVADKELLPFIAFLDSAKLPDSYFDLQFIQILDLYYASKYKETINLCKKYVQINPSNFDCIRIYVQSLIYMGYNYSPLTSEPESVINYIAHLVFNASMESDNSASLADLSDFNKRIYGLPIAAGVQDFISKQRKNKYNACVKCLSLTSFDPMLTRLWQPNDKDKALRYLDLAKLHGISSVAVDYYITLLRGSLNKQYIGVAPYILIRDLAKCAYLSGDYESCILECETLYNSYGRYLSIGQMASEYSFRSYVDRGLKMEAIAFFVDRYVQKRALVNSIQTDTFMESLRKERYRKNVKNTIDLLIFVFLNAFEDEQKAHVLQMYMNFNDASSMAPLIDEIRFNVQQDKQEIFLLALVEGDILRHLPYIGSTKQMLEEQQVVIQYLTQLTSANHALYEEYNKQILELMISYENIKKLDESRIYVNEPAIIKYELGECENLYRQLSSRNEVAKSLQSVYILQTTEGGDQRGVDKKLMQSSFKSTRNVTTDISTQIFNIIRDKYLFSKFGLKTYLSTRIRHGVLEGEIRSVFDSLHLMLTTQNNRFQPILYWQKNYGLSSEEQDLLMKHLEPFSSSLGQIIDQFKSDVIQIKVKDDDWGMFDYRLPDETKCFAVNSAQGTVADYDEFCAQILLFLDQVTEQSLVNIREYIRTDLNAKFVQLIDKLESDFQCFATCHFAAPLSDALAQSRENIQGCLAKIEKWFYLQTGVYDDFNLRRLMELVWNVTERQYPNIKHDLKVDVDDADIVVDAAHYLDIADMLTILYNNMFGHSITDDRRYSISVKDRGDYLILHFENQIQEDADSLNKTFMELLKSDNRLQLEGRSGLAKVKKIVMYDLKGEENDFSIIAENGVCKVEVLLRLKNLIRNHE